MPKNVMYPIQIIANGSMAGGLTSSVVVGVTTYSYVDVSLYDDVGIQFVWTGTPVGVLSVGGSNDGGSAAPTFTTLTFDPVIVQPAGSSSSSIAALGLYPFRLIQVVYTRTSGTGTLNAWLMAKGLS